MPDKKQYLVVEITGGEVYVAELPIDEEDKEQYSVEVMTEDEAQSRAGVNDVWNVELTR